MKNSQIINIIGLTIGFASFYFEILSPFWGVVFLYWVYKGLKDGYMVLFFETRKKDSPVVYWLLAVLWTLIGFYFLLYPLIDL